MSHEYSVHYYNSHTLLVVNKQGIIRTLYAPFCVKCVEAIGNIPNGASVYVEEIFSTEKDELRYMVLGKIYSYKHFILLNRF